MEAAKLDAQEKADSRDAVALDSFPHISYAVTVTTFSDSLSQAYLQIAQDFLQLSM